MRLQRPTRRALIRVSAFALIGLISATVVSVAFGLLPYWIEPQSPAPQFRTVLRGEEVVVRREVVPGRREFTIRGPNPKPPVIDGIDGGGPSPSDHALWNTWWELRKNHLEWEEQRALSEQEWSPPWWLPGEDRRRPEYEHPAIDPDQGFQPWVSFTAVGFPFTMFLDRVSLDTRAHYSEVEAPEQLLPWYEPLVIHREYLAMVKTSDVSDHFSVTYHIEVPLRVVPLGLAGNIAAHALAWWALLAAPFALRRALRRRAGKCVKCKYDLAGIDAGQPCPECGRVDEKRARLGSTAQEATAA